MIQEKKSRKKRMVLAWVIATVITLAAAYYQRVTGPTYPKKEKITLNGKEYKFKLQRSHSSSSDCKLILPVNDKSITAQLIFRRFPTNEKWDTVSFISNDTVLSAFLPKQPAAGKLEYFIVFNENGTIKPLSQEKPIIIRYKDDVPVFILLPHVILIFFAMLLSNLSGILAISKIEKARIYTFITFFTLLIAGMILGPIMQKYAFGAYWTGFPLGNDLTDNKTLVAFIAWLIAVIANLKKVRPAYIIAAAIITFLIFLIPHSLFGSELDHSTGKIITG